MNDAKFTSLGRFGLFLSIQPNGGRWWRQRYYLVGKKQLLSLGT